MKIGFIGLGRMGTPMVLNLRKANYDVMCYDVFFPAEKQEMLKGVGCTIAANLKEVVEYGDFVVTMVPADPHIKSIYLGDEGALAFAKPNTVFLEMTTAQGVTKQLVAEEAAKLNKGLKVLDAPVSGGVVGAEAGTLSIMVGCESQELFDKCLPVFEAMGKKIYLTGDVGAGANIKMLNNMLLAGNTALVAETVCVAKKLGIGMDMFRDIINQSTGQSFVTSSFLDKYMLPEDHTPGFRLDLMKKDIGLYMDTTRREKAFTPIANMVYQILVASSNQGNDAKDYCCIIDWFKENQEN